MSETTQFVAELRENVGRGASRRLRLTGRVPAILYGGAREPVALSISQNDLLNAAEREAFYASILEIKVGKDKTQKAVVRDMHRHPHKPIIMHIDFLRVSDKVELRMAVPIHFIGEEISPAGKASGVVIQHLVTDVEISALPKNLPEFVSVNLSEMDAGDAVMLSEIELPEGVTIPSLSDDEESNITIANAVHIKESQGTGAAAAAEADAALEEGELGGVIEEEVEGDEEPEEPEEIE